MSVSTGTMEDGVGLVVLAWQMARAWIPACAGMTIWGVFELDARPTI